MRKIIIILFIICLTGANISTRGSGECCVWGQGGDPPYLRVVRVCCYWADNSCCDSGTGGVAYCNTYYYSMDEYIGSDFYYVDMREIVSLFCGWIS